MVHAYKGLLKEKDALESSLTALSSSGIHAKSNSNVERKKEEEALKKEEGATETSTDSANEHEVL